MGTVQEESYKKKSELLGTVSNLEFDFKCPAYMIETGTSACSKCITNL